MHMQDVWLVLLWHKGNLSNTQQNEKIAADSVLQELILGAT